MNEATPRAAAPNGRVANYLAFRLGKEEFVIRVAAVNEIMSAQRISVVPRTPPWVKGVIEQRGRMIPIVDLRLKFGLPESKSTHKTCIIVMDVSGSGRAGHIGVIVDAVSGVASLSGADIRETSGSGGRADAPYVLGAVKMKDKVATLLDIDRVLSGREWDEVTRIVE